MKEYDCIKTLKLFKKTELKSFIQLLETSFLSSNQLHFNFLNFLIENKWVVDKKQIHNQFFKNETFNDVKIRLMLSDLNLLAEKFLAAKEAIEDKDYIAKVNIRHLKNNGSEILLDKLVVRDKKRISKLKAKDDDYFQHLNFLFLESHETESLKTRTQSLHLPELVHSLQLKQMIETLRISCLCISHSIVSGIEYDLGYFKNMISQIKEAQLSENHTLKFFYFCYTTLTEPLNEERFDFMLTNLKEEIDCIDEKDAKIIYAIIINFCIRRINFGQLEYGEKTLQLYISGIDSKALLNQGQISKYTYRNIITLGIKCNQLDLSLHICENYKNLLTLKDRASSYAFAIATIAYARNEFGIAQQNLMLVNFDDHLMNLAAKATLIKIFWDTNDFDLLSFHLDAMKIYVVRKKVIGYHKENYLNFIAYTRKLLRLHKLNNDQKKTTS